MTQARRGIGSGLLVFFLAGNSFAPQASAAVSAAVKPGAVAAAAAAAPADAESLPDVVTRGLEAYIQNGAEAALAVWIAGGPLQSDEFAAAQVSGLHRIEDFYGKYQGYEPIRVSVLTPRLKAVYLTMYFEKGAAFCYLLCYQTRSGAWVVSDFDGSNSPRRILPEYGAVAMPAVQAAGAAAGK